MSVKVKICGLTNYGDAEAAADSGADYLGFIFFPSSKRYIQEAAAKQIAARLRQRPNCPVLVGVFVNETAERMTGVLRECQLDLAQLSGEEIPALVADRESPLYGRAYKGIRPASPTEAEVEAEWFAVPERPAFLPSLLLDTYHPTLCGGTGETGDWAVAGKLAQEYPGLMLAGGLTAENVAAAVMRVRPFAVDVASGVEATPGKKDHNRLRAFIAAVRSASRKA